MSVSIDRLRELLQYDPEAGTLTWRERPEGPAWWNTQHAGKPAGTPHSKGYISIVVDGRKLFAHRIAWAIHRSEWPRHTIDHINGNKADNRISNLRDVTVAENHKNRPMQGNNTSGVTGVRWYKRDHRWHARIKIDGRQRHLGSFTDLADAVAARRAAERRHGFTARHGR